MKAVLKTKAGHGNVEVRDIPAPKPRKGEVLIEVKAAGICHTDIYLYEWAPAAEKEYKVTFPVVMGHELSGVVADIGAGVQRVEPGDPVLVNPAIYCGDCYFCHRGQQQLCLDRPLLGYEIDGGFAEYVVIRERNLFKLPPHVSLDVAALAEPFCVCIHALGRVPIQPGETLLISGPGPIGLMTLMLALRSGASRAYVSGLGRDVERLALARGLGGIPLNIDEVDVEGVILDETNGLGVDIAFEASGSSDALTNDIGLVRKGGRVGVLGLPKERSSFDATSLAMREKSIIGIRAYTPETWERCREILSNELLDLSPIISHRLGLEELERGIELVEKSAAIKVLLIPD